MFAMPRIVNIDKYRVNLYHFYIRAHTQEKSVCVSHTINVKKKEAKITNNPRADKHKRKKENG